MKVFVFDNAKCNGCYGCQIACKDEHVGNDWSPLSAPMPDTGAFWCKVNQVDHGQTPKVRVEYYPTMCNHCDDAACMKAAPEAVYRRDDGMVIIDSEKAQGIRALADACPFGNIWWNEELQLAQKCNGCAELLDEGMLPHCVDVCATGALRFGDAEEFADEIARAEFKADPAVGPHVYYVNMPHLFLAGDIYDAEEDECLEGVRVVLSDAEGTVLAEAATNDWGDFWFRKIDAGSYHVAVSAEGYVSYETDVELDKSLNIGSIGLNRA